MQCHILITSESMKGQVRKKASKSILYLYVHHFLLLKQFKEICRLPKKSFISAFKTFIISWYEFPLLIKEQKGKRGHLVPKEEES